MSSSTSKKPGIEERFPITPETKPKHRATMILAGVYAGVIVLIVALANTKYGEILSGEFYALTLTIILGMLTIVLLMVLMLMQKPPKTKKANKKIMRQASYECPDYYKLVANPTAKDDLANNVFEVFGEKTSVKCVPHEPTLFGASQPARMFAASNITNSNLTLVPVPGTNLVNVNENTMVPFSKFLKSWSPFYKGTDSMNRPKCGEIFPRILEESEERDEEGNPKTDLRCQYATVCGTNWASLGCSLSKTAA